MRSVCGFPFMDNSAFIRGQANLVTVVVPEVVTDKNLAKSRAEGIYCDK